MSEFPRVRANLAVEDIIVVGLTFTRGPGDYDCYHLMYRENWWTLRKRSFPPLPHHRRPEFVSVDGAAMWGRGLSRDKAIELATAELMRVQPPPYDDEIGEGM